MATPQPPRKPGDHPDDWQPLPGPQTRFLGLKCFEVLYGGAAGGGKSDALLIDAARYIGKGYGRHYKALLLRRTFPELEKSLVDRSRDLYPRLGGVYREDKRAWHFPQGEKIFFGHLENEKALLQYQGSAFQFIGFDELTHFTRNQYIYLFSRCRPTNSNAPGGGTPCRIRGATNPGGPGHEWVFERWGYWLDDEHPQYTPPGKILYFAPRDEGEEIVPKGTKVLLPGDKPGQEVDAPGRVFISAKLDDNKYLLADPTYRAALSQLDPVTRDQLRRGIWKKQKGKKLYFDREWVELLDSTPPGLTWVRAWDFAATAPSKENPDPDWTRAIFAAKWKKRVVYADLKSLRAGPGGVEELLQETAAKDGPSVLQLLPQDPGAAGKSTAAYYQRLVTAAGGAARVIPVSRKNKLTRFKPFSGFASPPNRGACFVRGPWNSVVFDELESFEGEDESEFHDDIVDVVADAFNYLRPGGDLSDLAVYASPSRR